LKDLLLGRNIYDGRSYFVDPKTRTTHMHIIGSSGEGKSKFMEHMIRHDIINNNGLCLVDPHGYLYNDLVKWCETQGMTDRKKIILFDPLAKGWSFGFNPLKINNQEHLSFLVDAMVRSCAKVWGGEDTDKTPLLKRCLRILFHVLAEKNLSLLDSHLIINHKDIRHYLTKDISDPIFREQWQTFNSYSAKDFDDKFSSTINRLMEFLSSDTIRLIIGQLKDTIDFRKIMDEGYILLCNLASKQELSRDNGRLLGALIVNDLFVNALGRPEKSRPFYLYVDECALFINEDVKFILDEGRKFGLHLILAHQHLSQLKKGGEDIYSAVMTDAKTKVVFGGLSAEDARILAEQMFLGELDLEEAKRSLNKPVVTGYISTWLKNHSNSSGSSSGTSKSSSRGDSSFSSSGGSESARGTHQLWSEEYPIITTSEGKGTSSSYSEGEGSFESYSESYSEGESEALMPVLEEKPSQVFSLEEQIYKAMALMVNQPTQHAIMKLPKKPTVLVKAPTVKPGYANNQRLERFKESHYKLYNFCKPASEAKKEIEIREMEIRKQIELLKEPKEEPTDFKTQGRPREEQPEEISDFIKAPGRKRKITKL